MKSSILRKFDTKSNFWKANPQLKFVSAVRELRRKDRTGEKVFSSKIMWGIAMLVDQHEDNAFRNLPYQSRKDLIAKDYFLAGTSIRHFKWSDYDKIIEFYKELLLTPAQRALSDWDDKMIERAEYFRDTPYNKDNAELLDKMFKNSKDIFAEYDRIKEKLEKEATGSITKGGVIESASEKGNI